MIDFDEGVDRVVKQTREDDFLRHAGLHRAVRALKNVIRGLLHPQVEKIQERRLRGHGLELFDLTVRLRCEEQIADASTVASRFDLRFDFGRFRKFLRGELRHHVRLERFSLRLRTHQLYGGGAAEAGDKMPAINLDHK